MKAQELRVGNLIRWKSTGEVETVQEINLVGLNKKRHIINRININDCEAIELTEDWLIDFGFVTGYSKVFHEVLPGVWWLNNFYIEKHGDYYVLCDCGIHVEIRTIHQLQNLYYALTGEELTFKQ